MSHWLLAFNRTKTFHGCDSGPSGYMWPAESRSVALDCTSYYFSFLQLPKRRNSCPVLGLCYVLDAMSWVDVSHYSSWQLLVKVQLVKGPDSVAQLVKCIGEWMFCNPANKDYVLCSFPRSAMDLEHSLYQSTRYTREHVGALLRLTALQGLWDAKPQILSLFVVDVPFP
jgi:hypothetical protein